MVSVGKGASLKDSLNELWPKVRQLTTKILKAYQENPEIRQKVADQVVQGAEFGTVSWPSCSGKMALTAAFPTGYAVTQDLLQGGLDTLNLGWRLELGECEFKHVDTIEQVDATGTSPAFPVLVSPWPKCSGASIDRRYGQGRSATFECQ